MKDTKVFISKDAFDAYENVRESGMTNMMDIRTVEDLSGLTQKEIKEIIRNYSVYEKQFK